MAGYEYAGLWKKIERTRKRLGKNQSLFNFLRKNVKKNKKCEKKCLKKYSLGTVVLLE